MGKRNDAKYPAIGWVECEQGPCRRAENGKFKQQADKPWHRNGRFARTAGIAFDVEDTPEKSRQQWDDDHQDVSHPAGILYLGPGA